MKKATKNAKTTKPVGRGFQPHRKGNSRIAESGDVLAAKNAKVAKSVGRDDLIAPRVVLVGTYKDDQLTKWRGWYNYPISGDDKIGVEDAHNHPSGDPTPSKADYNTTIKLNEGARLVGLELIDHIIIGSADSANGLGYVSMAELMAE